MGSPASPATTSCFDPNNLHTPGVLFGPHLLSDLEVLPCTLATDLRKCEVPSLLRSMVGQLIYSAQQKNVFDFKNEAASSLIFYRKIF